MGAEILDVSKNIRRCSSESEGVGSWVRWPTVWSIIALHIQGLCKIVDMSFGEFLLSKPFGKSPWVPN